MHIIPVIDIKDGIAVHARQGKRDEYLPLQSNLCQSSDIFAVIDAIAQHFHTDTFYLADLNALTRQGDNFALIKSMLTKNPATTFWIDAGFPPLNEFRSFPNYVPVMGSESINDHTINDIKHLDSNFILSLDYAAQGQLGPATLFEQNKLWPQRIIIMTLPRVGSNLGPDIELLRAYCQRYPHHRFIAAGGVRHRGDLIALEQIGIDSVLLATALHSGAIQANDI